MLGTCTKVTSYNLHISHYLNSLIHVTIQNNSSMNTCYIFLLNSNFYIKVHVHVVSTAYNVTQDVVIFDSKAEGFLPCLLYSIVNYM